MKAPGTVSHVIDLLQRRGFPSKFRNWITALLGYSSSRILLNGVAGSPIKHGRGLPQGDPQSPLLFVITIDHLQQLIELATRKGLLHKIRGRGPIARTSLYADDAANFMTPIKKDIDLLAGFSSVLETPRALKPTSTRALSSPLDVLTSTWSISCKVSCPLEHSSP